MDREKGQNYTYYILSPKEVKTVDEANPAFLAGTNELDGGRKRVVVLNDKPGRYVQQKLEGVIAGAGFPIVDTTVPKTGS